MTRSRTLLVLAWLAVLALILSSCSTPPDPNIFRVDGTPAPVQAAGTVPAGAAGALPVAKAGALKSYAVQTESKDELTGATPTAATAQVLNWTSVDMKVQSPGVFMLTSTDKTANGKQAILRMIAAGADGYIYSPEANKWLKAPMNGLAAAGVATTGVTTTGVTTTGAASAGADNASTLTGQILDPNTLAQAAPATLFAAGNVVSPHEQVNGVDTTHYRATGDVLQRWLSQEAGTTVTVSAGQADVWVANRDNYLKQYNLDATVQGQDGRMVHRTVHLLVTDENKPVSVQTPAPDQVMTVPLFNGTPIPTAPATPAAVVTAAAAQASDAARAALATVPAPPQSSAVAPKDLPSALQSALAAYAPGVASTRIYLSAAKMDALTAFYQTQMKQLGWTAVMSRAGKADQPALAMYSKNNINLMLVILPDPAEGKNVVLLQTEG